MTSLKEIETSSRYRIIENAWFGDRYSVFYHDLEEDKYYTAPMTSKVNDPLSPKQIVPKRVKVVEWELV